MGRDKPHAIKPPEYSVEMPVFAVGAVPLHIVTLFALPGATVLALQSSSFGPFVVQLCETRVQVFEQVGKSACDALIVLDDNESEHAARTREIVADLARDTAVFVVVAEIGTVETLDWLRRGAQEVLARRELAALSLPLRLRSAIERKRLEHSTRNAYATDLETGLPHQQQLIEHMSQLLALREREPAPMAVLALRIEGLATTEARLGREAANSLRRKLAVRLRAGVRASDVVASLSDDTFAVLLGSILTPADAARVGAKLLNSMLDPVSVAGTDVAVATALGIGHYPQDGAQPDALLRRAMSLAAAAPAQGRAGFANFSESGSAPPAANDD
jgi:diguanylate cyclase (GGDEF)-like protein